MFVTLFGIMTLVKLLYSNAHNPTLVTLFPITTLVKSLFWNAYSPIVITLSGITTLVKSLPLKACLPMLVTLSGIFTLVKPLLLNPHSILTTSLSFITLGITASEPHISLSYAIIDKPFSTSLVVKQVSAWALQFTSSIATLVPPLFICIKSLLP